MASPPSNFSGDWVTAEHSEYAAAIARWAANAERKAKVVAYVKTTADVVIVLKYAQEHRLPIAVRGGGHSVAGASSSEGGIVIDLSRYFAEVTVDAEKKLAYVGGGALWGTVDSAAMKHGLATVAGTISHTGVGGLTLGGGYGFLTGRHGLALDNVAQVTLVTADGQILTVNATENPDLFWAVRGGGSNFGVVTEFIFKLHPQRRTVFAGFVLFDLSKSARVTEELQKWWSKGLNEKEAVFHGVTLSPEGKIVVLTVLFFNGSEEEGRANFKNFFDIGPLLDTTKEVPYELLNTLQNEGQPHGKNYYMKGVFTTGPLNVSATDRIANRVTELCKSTGAGVTMLFEYIPTAKVLSVPNDATAHIRGNRVSSVAFVSWNDNSVDKTPEIRSAVNDLVEIVLQHEPILNDATTNVGYGNYIGDDPANPSLGSAPRIGPEQLFGENYPRLQRIKREWDPNSVFSRWCPIVPA